MESLRYQQKFSFSHKFYSLSRKFKPFLAPAVEITDTGTDGRGVGRFEQKVLFVDHAVPGDVIDVMVHSREKKLFIGRIEAIVKPSPWRVEQTCAHYGHCGGCKWQTLAYERQLFYKEKQVTDAFQRIGHLDVGEVLPILACEHPFHYRNKVDFTFANKRWLPYAEHGSASEEEKTHALGFHVARHFDKVLNLTECHLPQSRLDEVRNALRHFVMEQGFTFHDIRQHTGFLRNLVFRTSEATGEVMAILIVGEEDEDRATTCLHFLAESFPFLTSLIWMVNTKQNPSYGDLQARVYKGPAFLTEKLGSYQFRISPNSFFQTNTIQAARLYGVVKEWLGPQKHRVLWDLYCGAGSIGIFVSDLAEKIIGVEYVEAAVKDAWQNAQLNGLSHFEFLAGDMKHLLNDELVKRWGQPEVVITDPPRAGMDAKVVGQLLQVAPERIIYVSCNPATQARDLALMDAQYRVVKIRPVDMFPQTSHVENVALLQRR